MLIRMFHGNDSCEDKMSLANIKECKRTIALFVDKNEWSSGIFSRGRAILVNT